MSRLSWVAEACGLLLAPGATLDALARWMGGDAVDGGGTRILVDRPARLAARNAVIAEEDGRPASMSAWYARGEGPTLDEAAGELGPWHEYPRPAGGPCQGVFREGTPVRRCEIVGTTYDPPELGSARRLVEVAVLRPPDL